LSVVLPCLNEAETVAVCVDKAVRHMRAIRVEGEVIVADNGSTDGSQQLARDAGARVVHIPTRGYGAALMGGIHAARGKYVLMADSDDSYDLSNLEPFVLALRDGNELVMGNRFQGGIEPGAMPFLHRLGNPVLSGIGKLFFNIPTGDFHCGIRAFNRRRILELGLHTTGMEFASEIVVQSALSGLKIAEVPTTLSKDGRSRPPHLRTWRDGWRHLRFLLMYSPGWLFFLPGYTMMVLGVLGGYTTINGPRRLGSIVFDTGTLVVSALLVVTGVQLVLFWLAARAFAKALGLMPHSTAMERWLKRMTLDRGVVFGAIASLAGAFGIAAAVLSWRRSDFGSLDPARHLRLLVPSATAVVVGLQLMFGSFLLGISKIKLARTGSAFIELDIDEPVAT
jgi:glycosyltransferase involved in cell wall biosynthesis